jgi:hypothetical protein
VELLPPARRVDLQLPVELLRQRRAELLQVAHHHEEVQLQLLRPVAVVVLRIRTVHRCTAITR